MTSGWVEGIVRVVVIKAKAKGLFLYIYFGMN